MNWLKVIPLVGAAINLIERLVNKPKPAPVDKTAAQKAAERWNAAKQRIGK